MNSSNIVQFKQALAKRMCKKFLIEYDKGDRLEAGRILMSAPADVKPFLEDLVREELKKGK